MRDALRLRLGIAMPCVTDLADHGKCSCCGQVLNGAGDATNHMITCTVAGGRRRAWSTRSSALQKVTGKMLNECGFVTRMEIKVNPDVNNRRSDIVVENFPATNAQRRTADLHLDNAVTHAAGTTGIQEGANKTRGRRAKNRAKEKHNKYDSQIPQGCTFKAAVVETFGHIDHEFKGVLRTAAESHANQSASDLGLSDNARALLVSNTMQRIYSRISVEMQKSLVHQVRTSATSVRDQRNINAGISRRDAIIQRRYTLAEANLISHRTQRTSSLGD
jgi:hypothetical protein